MNGKARRGRALRGIALVAALALLTAGCGGNGSGGDEPTPSESATDAESKRDGVDRSRQFMAKVRAVGTGAAEFTWEGEQEIILTRVGGPGIDVNLLSAGFEAPELLDDPAFRFRWAFDLLNAYEDQPGTFEITSDPVNAQGLKSQAFLIWMKVKDPSKEAVFDMEEVEFLQEFRELNEPCTVEIGENESTGTLTCPALATSEGEVAGVTITWEEVAA